MFSQYNSIPLKKESLIIFAFFFFFVVADTKNYQNGIENLSKKFTQCVFSRYYALSASSALITYIQDTLFVYYGAGTIKIEYQESEGNTIIGEYI